MPEKRYKEIYEYPKDMPAELKVPENALITYEPYEVSDEELEREAQEVRIAELAAKLSRTLAENSQLINLLAIKLGYAISYPFEVKNGG